MKTDRALSKITLLLLLILPFILGSSNQQEDEDVRFYLSNYNSFSPGSNVTVNLYQYDNQISEYYNLRLFRITEPVNFFTNIQKPSLSGNFDIWGKDKESLLKYTELIKEWRNAPEPGYGYRGNLKIGTIDKPGIYIIQAAHKKQVGYCAVVVSDLALVYKNSGSQLVAFLADASTSQFQTNVKFQLVSAGKPGKTVFSDREGLAVIPLESSSEENSIIIAQTGDETIVSDPYWYFQGEQENFVAYIYTNQPVYRPGQEVSFKAILRQKKGNEIINISSEQVAVTVKSPKNKEIYSGSLTTNEFGSLSGSLVLDEDAELGSYSIIIQKGENELYGSFTVEEYKKPEYYVTVTTEKENYAEKDLIKGTITANYYFGSPVLNGKVTLNIFRNTYWRPWWYWSEYSWFYRSFSNSSSRNNKAIYQPGTELIHQVTGELNSEGKFEFEYLVKDKSDYDYVYSISAEVTDLSRRAISGNKDVFVTRGSFTLSTSPDKYFYEKGSEIKIKVNASDFSDKPISTNFKIAVGYPDPNKKNYYNSYFRFDTLYGKTDAAGRAVVDFRPGYEYSGYFRYTVMATDEKGRLISAVGSFFIGDHNDYWYSYNAGLEIITDKDSYENGDSLIAYIFLPTENTELLLSYETTELISFKKYSVKEKSFVIKEKLNEKFTPSFNISLTFVKDRQFYTTSKLIGVLAKEKLLNISFERNKKEYKPGDEAIYTLSVRDFNGLPVKNTELSVGIVDESIYAIMEEQVQPIQNFFFSPQYSYIPVYSSLNRNSYSGGSRHVTYADQQIFSEPEKGDLILEGKVYIEENKLMPFAYVMLSSDNGYYKTQADSSGNYKIKNVAEGKYDLLVSSGDDNIVFVERITIEEDKKYDVKFNYSLSSEESPRGQVLELAEMSDANESAVYSSIEAPGMVAAKREMFAGKTSYVKAETRSNFVDAAFWKAHIVTDENGKATVKFKMPDNLTTWRATARGITSNTQAGEQTDKAITRKDLLVRMETPRFFREGDELSISTIVHNYLNERKKTKISFKAENIELLSSEINTNGYDKSYPGKKGVYEIYIDRNSELRIDWKVKVTSPTGEAVLNAEALTNEESDALKLNIPILPKGFREVNVFASDFQDENKDETIEFTIPQGVDLRTASLSLNAAPSMAGTILKALDELVDYPYGCVEQTMSRFLPAIIAANTFKDLKAPLKAATIQKLPEVVDAGLKRLYSFQHDDGGWGWWENDQTHPYMTAYVVYGFSLAKAAGYEIDQNLYQNGINNLVNQLSKADLDITTLSFMLYSLSAASSNGFFNYRDYNKIMDKVVKDNADPYALALLIIAAENFNDKNLAGRLTSELIKSVKEENNFAYWGGKQFHYNWQDDKVQGTAFAVKALMRTNQKPELVSKAVKWLLLQKQGFSWRSTQETASVIFALTDYLKMTKELNPDFNVAVYVNDQKVLDKKFNGDDVFKESPSVKLNGIDRDILKKGTNKIRIVKSGAGKLYFAGINEYFSREETPLVQNNRFRIKREFYILKPEQAGDRIVYEKKDFNGTVKTGEDIFVKTYVESTMGESGLQYFLLEDMLPSGFEIVKDEDKYNIEGERNYPYDPYPWYRPWRWFYADKEYRDEKTSFFVTNIPDNRMEFTYIMKAQIPGKYTVMPSSGSLMYYPEVNGNSGMINIEVVE